MTDQSYRYPALGDRAVLLRSPVGFPRGLVVGIDMRGPNHNWIVDLLLDGGGHGRFRMEYLAEEGDWEAWSMCPSATAERRLSARI